MINTIRKTHRWIAPVFVLAVIAVIVTGLPQLATPAQVVRQILMLLLMLSGIVLFAYPFWARQNKDQKDAIKKSAAAVRTIRKGHRWMGPVFVLAFIAVIVTGPLQPATPAQVVQQILMLLLMLSGVVLFAYPFWARRRKQHQQEQRSS